MLFIINIIIDISPSLVSLSLSLSLSVPIFSLALEGARVVENAGPAQVTIFRSGNTNDQVSVQLATRGKQHYRHCRSIITTIIIDQK